MADWSFFNGKYLHAHAINYNVAGLEETSDEGGSALLSYEGYRKAIQKHLENLPDGKLSSQMINDIKNEIAAVLSELATDNFKQAALDDTLNDLQREFLKSSEIAANYISEITNRGDIILSDDVLESNFNKKLDDSINEYKIYDKLVQDGKNIQKEIKRITNPKNPNHLVETDEMIIIKRQFEEMLKEFQRLTKTDPVLKQTNRLTSKYQSNLTSYVNAANAVMKAYKNSPRPTVLGALGEFVTKKAVNRAIEKGLKEDIYPELSNAIRAGAIHTAKEKDLVSITIPSYLNNNNADEFLKAMKVKINKNTGDYEKIVNTGDGSVKYIISDSEAKADVTIYAEWEDGSSLFSGLSVKNYSLGEGRWLTATSGNPFGTLVSNGETYLDDFFAHYFNLTVSHSHSEEQINKDGKKTKRRKNYKFNNSLYKDAHITMKIYLLYQALAGVFGREHNAEYFVVIDHSKKNTSDFIAIISIKDFVLSILKDIDKINNRIVVKLGKHSLVSNAKELYGEMKWVEVEKSSAGALRKAKAQRIQHFYNTLMAMPTEVKVNASIKGLNLINR